VDPKPLTIYSAKLTDAQAEQVKNYLDLQGFEKQQVPYARFAGKKGNVGIVFYESGKLVVQGKGTEEFIQFFLEPEVFKEARLGYEEVLNPKAFEPHIGVDESGKGDFFGPLVVASVFASKEAFPIFKELKVRDSKKITSDRVSVDLAKSIRSMKECAVEVIAIGPEAYNRLHLKMRNVNDILGWGHARAIENVLAKIDPKKEGKICTRAISDQFGNKRIIERALMERGKTIELEQRHRAEEDLAVAAASIVARAGFIQALGMMSKKWGIQFPKGASQAVIAAGKEFVLKHGRENLEKVSKVHFQTTHKVIE
jgi:ribonuclease HIII